VPTKRGGRWYQGTVGNIARDPFYAGLIDVDSELVAGQHPALIDAATHERIKAVLYIAMTSPSHCEPGAPGSIRKFASTISPDGTRASTCHP
jgi:hypothetical protein